MKSYLTLIAICLATGSSWAESIRLDASGADGIDARNGTSYSTYPGASSGHGSNGGDAGPSTPGKDAQNITVDL